MKYLKLMETILYALEYVSAGKRTQVSKDKITELKKIVLDIKEKLGDKARKPELLIIFENLYNGLLATETLNISVLPDSIKETIVEGLEDLKGEIADIVYMEFVTQNIDFQPTSEVIRIMREVIKCEAGRGVI